MDRYLVSEEADRVNELYLQRDVGYTSPRQAVSGAFLTRTTVHTPPQRLIARPPSRTRSGSSVSSAHGSCFDSSHGQVSIASSDSTAPPLRGPPPWFTNANPSPAPAVYNYELSCEFSFAGCRVQFAPDDWANWLSHTLSHLKDNKPPSRAICIFCNHIFEDSQNPISNWRARMFHMGAHFQNGHSPRPDFFMIEHMKTLGFISDEDYAHAMSYSERPQCKHLVSRAYKTKEKIQQDEKMLQEIDDLQKEQRTIRKQKQQRKGKGADRHSAML